MSIGLEFDTVMAAARTGAEWAWRALYRDLAPAVLGYLRARGAPSPEDVCGDAFCQVVRDIHTFEGDESGFRSWVFVIAHHRMLDERRRVTRRSELAHDPSALVRVVDPSSFEDTVIGNAEIDVMLDRLTPAQRDVVLLRVIAGLSVEQTAAVLGKQPGAVRSLQHRGIETLRKAIETFDGAPALTKTS